MAAQEVVMIQDSATEVDVNFMKWELQGLPLRAGDKLTLISVLHQVNTPLGYRRVDSCSMFGANPKIVELEAAKIQGKYEKHEGLIEISQLYETETVEFKIEVATGPSCRHVGVEAAKKLKATLVILTREMKNDTKYFLENLSCGISRVKSNGKIEVLRAPKTRARRSSKLTRVMMISRNNIKPADHNEASSSASRSTGEDDDLFSIEI